MNKCPCCSNQLLRHIRQNGAYWFCTHCRQEMPSLPVIQVNSRGFEPQLKPLKSKLTLTIH